MFESQPAEDGIMDKPPRSLGTKLFSGQDLLRSFLQGLLVLGVITGSLWYGVYVNKNEPDHTRAFTFILLAMSNIGLIFADMSGGQITQLRKIFSRPINAGIVLVILSLLLLLTQVHLVRVLFRFSEINGLEFSKALGVAFLLFVFISAWNLITSSRLKARSLR